MRSYAKHRQKVLVFDGSSRNNLAYKNNDHRHGSSANSDS